MYQVERHLYRLLIDKINIFNEIYMLDYLNTKHEKKWKDYLDPIANYLYNISYDDLIIENIFMNSMPGLLEMYYNIFYYISQDLHSISMVKTAKELLISVNDIKRTFDKFLVLNNFKVERVSIRYYGVDKIKFNIYPMV